MGTFPCLGSKRAVELLIRNGTNVNVANKYGTTALMAAAKNGNSWAQNQVSLNLCKQFIYTCAGDEKMIKILLENNAINVNAVDSDGHTALDAVTDAVEGK